MKLEAKIKKNSYPLEVTPIDDTHFQVQIGDKTFEVDLFQPEDHIMSLLINGKSYEAYEMEAKKGFRFQIESHTFDVQLVDPMDVEADAASGGVGGMEEITSPMPGRVVCVEVKVGDKVEEGQGVAVVEAMKMENELTSPISGTVKEVPAKEGEAVESGQVLVVIEG
jgi:biotin carboxyl carrier protein